MSEMKEEEEEEQRWQEEEEEEGLVRYISNPLNVSFQDFKIKIQSTVSHWFFLFCFFVFVFTKFCSIITLLFCKLAVQTRLLRLVMVLSVALKFDVPS